MATHNTITNVPFSFEVLDAGMGTNTLDDLATAEWQPIIQVNTANIDMRIDNLAVEFTSTTDSETVNFGTVTLDSDSSAPDYSGVAALFPDLGYSVGVEELTAVTISGDFTYLRGSTSPINGTTAVTAGVRYNKTGTPVSGLLTLISRSRDYDRRTTSHGTTPLGLGVCVDHGYALALAYVD